MNVIQKFLEKYNQCIILLSGFEQLHLSKYANDLAQNFDFHPIKFNYPHYDNLNNDVNKYSKKGVVVYGLTFEKDKLNFKPNIHISLSSGRGLINDDEKYQIYNDNIKNNIINKFKNIKNLDYSDDVYADIFNLCIDMIMRRIYGDRYDEAQKKYAEISEKEPKLKNVESDDEELPPRDVINEDSEYEKALPARVRARKNQEKKKKISPKRIIGTRILQKRIKL